jgi:hypothetical protein
MGPSEKANNIVVHSADFYALKKSPKPCSAVVIYVNIKEWSQTGQPCCLPCCLQHSLLGSDAVLTFSWLKKGENPKKKKKKKRKLN